MRILIISIYYKPEPVPKPHELAEGLARLGHRVTVVTGFPNYPTGRFYPGYSLRFWRTQTENGVRVVRVPLYPNHSASAVLRAAHYLTFFISAVMLGAIACGSVDVVYVWGNPPTSGLAGWVVARLRAARLVYGVHDLWPDIALASGMIHTRWLRRAIGVLERFVLSRAALVLPISEGFKRRILQHGVPPERVHVIPHWADGAVYRPVPPDRMLEKHLGLSDSFVILYAGNVGRLQGLDHLVEAAVLLQASLASLRVVIVGDGVERESLRRKATERGSTNVIFIDPQPPDAIVAYSAIADALYVGLKSSSLASLSVPSKVQTYLACGRPILCNVPGETAELIGRHGLGVNCAANTPPAIAEAIERMVALSEAERALMGRRAREVFVRDFSMESLLARHEELMEALLA